MKHIPKQEKILCGCHSRFGHLLYVVTWTGVIGNLSGETVAHKVLTHDRVRLYSCSNENNNVTHLYNSSEPVQTVANCDVDGLPEYSVSPL